MNISLCITTYNKPVELRQVLGSVLAMRTLPMEILVCDDGSTGETRQVVEAATRRSPVPLRHLWQPDEGWRVSKVRNMGIKAATGDYLVFIDGDCLPHRFFMDDHNRLAEPGAMVLADRAHVRLGQTKDFFPRLHTVLWGIISGRIIKRSGALRNPFERPVVYQMKDVTPAGLADLALGCNMGFWKGDIDRINGFDESIEGWGLEDIEMAARLLASGLRAKKVRRLALVYHLDHGDPKYERAIVMRPTEEVFATRKQWTQHGLRPIP